MKAPVSEAAAKTVNVLAELAGSVAVGSVVSVGSSEVGEEVGETTVAVAVGGGGSEWEWELKQARRQTQEWRPEEREGVNVSWDLLYSNNFECLPAIGQPITN